MSKPTEKGERNEPINAHTLVDSRLRPNTHGLQRLVDEATALASVRYLRRIGARANAPYSKRHYRYR